MSKPDTPHPWQAQVKVSKNRISKHVCSGVILTERHILTSASCVVDNPIKHYIVVVGQNDLDELDEWEEEYSVQRYSFLSHHFFCSRNIFSVVLSKNKQTYK